MKVFVLGATGYIGRHVVAELVRRGHTVTALVRSDAGRVGAEGAGAVVGDLQHHETWLPQAAATHDALVHCAADRTMGAAELAASEESVLFSALAEAAKPGASLRCVISTTSGSCLFGQPHVPDEYSPTDKTPLWTKARFDVEARFIAAGAAGPVRTAVVRPSWVYGNKGGIIATFASMSVGASPPRPPVVVAGGSAVLPLVHVADLARQYVAVLEAPDARGPFNGVADDNLWTWREFAEALSRAGGMGGAVLDLPFVEAQKVIGFLAELLARPLPYKSTRAKEMGFVWKEARLMDDFARFYAEATK